MCLFDSIWFFYSKPLRPITCLNKSKIIPFYLSKTNVPTKEQRKKRQQMKNNAQIDVIAFESPIELLRMAFHVKHC